MPQPDDSDEIDRAASAFIERFGARAVEEARLRAYELEEAGDDAAQRTWLRIAAAAEAMLHQKS